MAAAQSKSRSWPEHSSWGKSHWRSTSKVPMATEFARFRLRALGLGGEKEKAALVFFEKFGKAFIGGKREIGPVVQPGVAQLFVFQLKAHGPHQVQGRAGDGAGAGDVPRVLGDFRLY